MKMIIWVLFSTLLLCGGQYDNVRITPEMSYIYVYHKGKAVKIHRIQDTSNKLTGEYAKQYRPYQDVQPIKVAKNIQTIGEVELLYFMQDKGNTKQGIVIDVRNKEAYQKESIPSAVNIPSDVIYNPVKMEKMMKIFGAIEKDNGSFDTENVRDLVVYCHGLWCSKSSEFIQALLDLGYPAKKLYYYRGGFQMWKILGFTTVTNK